MNGVIMEHSAFGPGKETEEIVREYVRQAMQARNLAVKDIISASSETMVVSDEIHCAFATVSMW
jgi:pyruvoyl-dependent arginine decarboxylase (PvlArgDC)